MLEPTVLFRRDWRPGDVHPEWTELVRPVDTLFIHHSVTPRYATALDAAIALEQIARSQGHFGISYPWALWIGDDGPFAPSVATAIEGRGGYVGAATEGWNSRSQAICIVGNFHEPAGGTDLPDRAVRGVQWLVAVLKYLGAITPDCAIRPHGTKWGGVMNTACPGDRVVARFAELLVPYVAQEVAGPVLPDFNPPFTIPECVSFHEELGAGAWALSTDGGIFTLAGDFYGSPQGKSYFAGRTAARLERNPAYMPESGGPSWSLPPYVVVATSGEVYGHAGF